jgi:hypothetical protein
MRDALAALGAIAVQGKSAKVVPAAAGEVRVDRVVGNVIRVPRGPFDDTLLRGVRVHLLLSSLSHVPGGAGERGKVREELSHVVHESRSPLSPALSPAYRGEGVRLWIAMRRDT